MVNEHYVGYKNEYPF